MTRFLQRLAEHAMGLSKPARSASAAPFVPAPQLAEEVVAVEAPTVAYSPPAAPARGQRANERSRAETPDEGFAGAAEIASAKPPEITRVVTPEAERASRNSPVAAYPSADREPSMPAPTRAETASPLERVAEEAMDRPGPKHVTHVEFQVPPENPARTPTASGDLTAPAPLLPREHETQPAYRPATLAVELPARQGRGSLEETTEVHVSIGRIEVTAVHEPAPAKPAPARRSAPMSLDEYLARRQGRRP